MWGGGVVRGRVRAAGAEEETVVLLSSHAVRRIQGKVPFEDDKGGAFLGGIRSSVAAVPDGPATAEERSPRRFACEDDVARGGRGES